MASGAPAAVDRRTAQNMRRENDAWAGRLSPVLGDRQGDAGRRWGPGAQPPEKSQEIVAEETDIVGGVRSVW